MKIEMKQDYQTILKPKGDASSLPGSFFQSSDPRVENLVDRVLVDRSGTAFDMEFLSYLPQLPIISLIKILLSQNMNFFDS